MTTLPDRFWAKVARYPSGCMVWQAALNSNGYGVYNLDGRTQLAHRLAYVDAKGPIPDGLQVDHLCRVRACVNPDHLEAVTQSVNLRRRPGVRMITHVYGEGGVVREATHAAIRTMLASCPTCRHEKRPQTSGAK